VLGAVTPEAHAAGSSARCRAGAVEGTGTTMLIDPIHPHVGDDRRGTRDVEGVQPMVERSALLGTTPMG
jgi:hypothetical protein